MIKLLSWLTAFSAVLLFSAACDNYSHNSIVNTPPANYVNLVSSYTYGGDGFDWGASVATTSDNEYVISGSTTSSGYGENTLYLARAETHGNLKWQKHYGGPGNDNGEAVVMASDTTILTAGVTTSFDLESGDKIDRIDYMPPGDYNFYVIKTDTNGVYYWENVYGDTAHTEWATSLAVSSSGYLIAGYQIRSDMEEDFYIVKTNEEGEADWQLAHGSSNLDRAYGVTATSDGGFVIGGYSRPVNSAASDPYLLKVSATGAIVWERLITNATNREKIYSVIQTHDGGIVAAGASYITASSTNALYVMKVNSGGTVQWEHTYSQAGMKEGRCILEDASGDLLICGQNSSANAIQVAKIDGAGSFKWSDASGAEGYGMSMTPSQNHYVIAGSTTYPDHSELNNVLMIKIEEDATNVE